MQIKLLVDGGSMQPGPALSQKLGPAGINIQQVITQVNEATSGFKGIKLPVELDVNVDTKEIKVNVFSPPVSQLLKKELGIEKGSATQKKMSVANASIEQIISVSKTKLPGLLCNNLKTAVKTVVGTCASLGVLIENKPATEIEEDIGNGVYDKEINEEKTETAPEKREKLDSFIADIKGKQEQVLKQEQAVKDAEAEKKEQAAKAAPAAGAAPAAEKK